MSEERLERIESHLVQLIQMAAQNNQAAAGLAQRIDKLEQRMDKLEQRMDKLEQRMDAETTLNAKRHLEIKQLFRHVNADISYLDEQVAKHEELLNK
jgi:predicted  nucleic acid-binding Zn-ribbon protein